MAITIDLKQKGVLITGGTRGLGRAMGLEFARAGASVFLTHRWGSTDEDELAAEFTQEGLPAPHVLEADVSDADATRELLGTVRERAGDLHTIVSNVAFSKVVNELGDLKKKSLDLSLSYSAWPLVDLVQASEEVFGRYPPYVIAISSDGGEVCHAGYDFAGASKAVLETLVRYLSLRLKEHGTRVNALRPGFLDTDSSRATFGADNVDRLAEERPGLFLDTRSVARTAVGMASGCFDAVTGQVIVVDEGWSHVSPMSLVAGVGLPGAFPDGESS